MTSSIRVWLTVMIACFFLAGGVSIARAAEAVGDKGSPGRDGGPYHSPTYIIGKGDVLEVNVWREPMLSGEVIVRNDGKISVTLVGDLDAAGKTTEQLRNEIQAGLKQFVGEPAVTVIVRTPNSQRFYIMGEVKNPGEYELVKELTVLQAISRAGGFTEWAATGQVLLLRKEDGTEKRIPINYKEIVKGKNIEQNVLIRPNDTIVVP